MDVRVNTEAVALHPERKTVTLKGPRRERDGGGYDRLLLSPGAVPFRPSLPGIDLPGIFTLRNVADTDAIADFMACRKVPAPW